ncbi:SDR family NAD(P)-dependent oxidoreductase [Peristeroidobacter agariperforans]|uniref:SDR family NAD(P)-dependent oxidoreductase n=1 Tax=Peristeroidobacter agariperforans TaxID=268404 RepID=UPI0018E4F52A|nr:SDR family NAD(P)-dependent oxidoreductase [Peristeroidobacter agariperforans]
MKQQLQQIYQDLSTGKLSKTAALEIIATLKRQQQSVGVVLASPQWQASADEIPSGSTGQYAEQLVLLCDLPEVDAGELATLVSNGRCQSLRSEGATIAARYSDYAVACFEAIQNIVRGKPKGKVLVRIAMPDVGEHRVFMGLSALLKTATLENPSVVGQCILVPADITSADLAPKLRGEASAVVRYQNGVRQVQAWAPQPATDGDAPIAFKDHGVYLITGGRGGLGQIVAREILQQTRTAKVILAGRSAPDATNLPAAEPGRVEYRCVDVTDLGRVEQLISSIVEEHGQLNGIIHSAGVTADNFILKKTSAEFRGVLASKVTGTFNLDFASRHVELDFLVLFSSIAAVMGNAGQADYAAANGFLDRFAAHRNRAVAAGERCGRTVSINWPFWSEGGMTLDSRTLESLRNSSGIQPMQTATGIQALYRCLQSTHDQMLVMEGELAQLHRVLANQTLQAQPATIEPAPSEPFAKDADDLLEKTRDYLRKQFSTVLKLPAHNIDPRAGLERYGIDSILAVSLINSLERTFGPLSKTLLFEYQNVQSLAEYFVRSHAAALDALFFPESSASRRAAASLEKAVPPAPNQRPAASVAPVPTQKAAARRRSDFSSSDSAEPIAIVGLSGRYPEAPDLGTYWRNLRDGRDCIVEVPKDRWDWRDYFSEDRTQTGRHFSKWGGFIAGVDEFDPLFFNISPKEAKGIDPQERLFLQHAWLAIEDAGYTRASLPNDRVGVYAGAMHSEYQLFGAEASAQGQRMAVSSSFASIANRVSYFLNLHGPSMTLDTMCSSSLTAIHLACQDLRLGRTQLAIAGGVNVSIHPNKYLLLSAGQFISSDGHCQSFGEGGDGYIPGEGVGVVVLKRLSEAERDGNVIYGVIRGSALNHGGKTNGYTVPNPQAQSDVIRQALTDADLDPRHISYIEAHGTGTKLGDPIEITALSNAFRRDSQASEIAPGTCVIGSAKSNIGHCESAAGIAGLTKVLLQMKHRQIAPSLHSSKLNPHIDFDRTPFVVNQSLREWECHEVDGQRVPRIAGISSFGAGGSNAHVIVEEYRATSAAAARADEQVVVPLSAKTTAQLEQKARDLLAFIGAQTDALDLICLAHTLQVGREALEERLGLVAGSVEQLTDQLQQFLAGNIAVDGLYRGQAGRHNTPLSVLSADADFREVVDRWIAEGKLSKLVESWVNGVEVGWQKFHEGRQTPRLMSLPGYPFAKERYWLALPSPLATAPTQTTALLHPLVHKNTSTLAQQSYTSSFSGTESFLERDEATDRTLLPEWTALEMMRAAVELASSSRSPSDVLELRDIAWGRPIEVIADRSIRVALQPRDDGSIDVEIVSADGIVHCQSTAAYTVAQTPDRLDIAQLESAKRVRLAAPSGGEKERYSLCPELLKLVAESATNFAGEKIALLSMHRVRLLIECPDNALISIRRAAPAGLDIDVCNEQGDVCLQARGLQYEVAENTAVAVPALSVRSEPREIPLGVEPAAPVEAPVAAKARKVTLAATDELPASEAAPRAAVTLLDLASPDSAPATVPPTSPLVKLFDLGNGVFSIDIASAPDAAPATVIESLLNAVRAARREASLKVLLIKGKNGFWPGDRAACNRAIDRRLFSEVASFPFPVIAVMQGDACGSGFLLASVCDLMVGSKEGRYEFTSPRLGLFPTKSEERFFVERFGAVQTDELLYRTGPWTGEQLLKKGWTCWIVPAAKVDIKAMELAADLAQKSHTSLRLLKEHLARELVPLVDALTVATPTEAPGGLDARTRTKIVSPVAHLSLEASTENVAVVQIGSSDVGIKPLIADLAALFEQIGQFSGYRAIVLTSAQSGFLPSSETVDAGATLELRRLVQGCKVPVITAFRGDAEGAAWLLGLWSDACVYQTQGRYRANAPWEHLVNGQASPSSASINEAFQPVASSSKSGKSIDQSFRRADPALAREIASLSVSRLGPALGQEACLTGRSYKGADLRARAGALTVVDAADVIPQALRLAEFWAEWPRETIEAWKQSRVTAAEHAPEILPVEEEATPTSAPKVPRSDAVTVANDADGVAVITMHDRQTKNLFSESLLSAVKQAFAYVEHTPACKVVVLTGYDTYFAAGGTKGTLLSIQQGKAQFTDERIYEIALNCSLPVIAAMQGHAIGAGWSLGMFADLVVLGEESRFHSPYMGYGFTPGAGATLVFPRKIGHDLARETLLTAREIAGHELRDRGLQVAVMPRREVLSAAIELARNIAKHSRSQLKALKRQWTHSLRQAREEVYRREVQMHEQTFVGKDDTLAQIETKFSNAPVVASPRVEAAQSTANEGPNLRDVIATLRGLLAHELHMQADGIDEGVQFTDLGLDSITGVTWIRKINDRYGTSIEATKVYSYPTLAELSRFVMQEAGKTAPFSASVQPRAAPAEPARPKVAPPKTARRELVSRLNREPVRLRSSVSPRNAATVQRIAVIGMAGQFPKANDLDQFWENIAAGRDCISEVANKRWRLDDYYQPGEAAAGKTYSKWLGALEDYDAFDPLFFNISPTEAECMDPQQRVFLQACWHGIENAGYDSQSLSGSRCGVFVGCAAGDYHQLPRRNPLGAQDFTGAATSILAARIAYFLNLRGPCLSIDTACSSSLVAIAEACDSLSSGTSDLALAGGVYVMSGPSMHIMTSQAGMLSSDGRCFTFDQRANGFVIGEGVGVVVLKRLADAERDGDRILGVIEGWGVNQDGKTNGITAPNEDSQARLLQSIYERFEIDPAGIQLIEAHGTGTKLGDPIEVAGLKAAFKPFTDRQDYCALGSVKSNIGHCLTAAGVAGVAKLLLAMRHRQLPPAANFSQCNEHIDLSGTPFYVNGSLADWNVADQGLRRAAVSSFGFSGTNAHIVIAEHAGSAQLEFDAPVWPQGEKFIVPLSARNETQLRQKAEDLLKSLRKRGATLRLVDVAYTLQVARDSMSDRVVFLAGSLDELIARLEAYVASEAEIAGAFRGLAKQNKDEMKLFTQDDDVRTTMVGKWLRERKLAKLAQWWSKGLTLDWKQLYGEAKPRRIELPGYPFAKDRFWIDGTGAMDSPVDHDRIHPLVHGNASLLSQQRYQSSFAGNEFFLDDTKAFPALSLVEMARAAIVHATSDHGVPAALSITGMEWDQPLFVTEPTEVTINLEADDDVIEFEIQTEEVHARGRAELVANVQVEQLDLAGTMGRMTRDELQPTCVDASLQGLKEVFRGDGCLLARIEIGQERGVQEYALHPCLLEGAWQACTMFLGADAGSRLPASIDSVTIASTAAERMYALIRYASTDDQALDVDLYDEAGNACVLMRGVRWTAPGSTAAAPSNPSKWDGISYLHRWEECRDSLPNSTLAHQTVLIVCRDGSYGFEEVIRQRNQQANVVLIRLTETTAQLSQNEWRCGERDPRGFETALQGVRQIDALYFLAASERAEHSSVEQDAEGQLLRLVKFLKQSQKVGDMVDTYILTVDNHSLTGEANARAGAGASGLGYSLAQGNYQFRVRNLDLSAEDLRDPGRAEQLLTLISREPSSDRGEVFKLHAGKRYRGSFFKLNWGSPTPTAIKQNGVYLIVGGTGIVGRIITRNLIHKYAATVVWLGRSDRDSPKVRSALQSFAEFGNKLSYLQADVLSLDSMRQAVATIKNRHSALNGAIFSGMVFGIDNSIDQISEAEFESVVGIKTQGSRVFHAALSDESLDFMVYFSSGQAYSFSGAMTVAAYAAGISAADSFTRSIQSTTRVPVGTINWGAWRAFVKERMEVHHDVRAKNVGSLSDEEGFACFERFVGELQQGRVHQVLCMRVSAEVQPLINCNSEEIVTLAADAPFAPPVSDLQIELPGERIATLIRAQQRSDLDDWFSQLLFYQLNRLVEASDHSLPARVPTTVAELHERCRILDKYIPWVNESLRMLAKRQLIELRDDVIVRWDAKEAKAKWHEWQLRRQAYVDDAYSKALTALVTDCLVSLPDILNGNVSATDVIFPNSSPEKVAALYKENAVADTYNEVVGDAVLACLQQRLQADPSTRLRILEIGAGTGGTSAMVFAKLKPFQHAVDEYCYTDLSKAFFLHAEENYLPGNPYIVCRRLDIEQPIEPQGIEAGTYDVVIATNVLHATRDIRQTLRNAKAALRSNGFLLLNEISDKSLSPHLTVALLDGWWLFQDPELRIPGCPGLYPQSWKRVLEEEGFCSVQFPAEQAHVLGNQVIVARSNGVIRQKAVSVAAPVVTKAPMPVERRESTPVPVRTVAMERAPAVSSSAHVRETILGCLSKTLKVPASSIGAEIAFSDYGIDSILGVNFVKQLNDTLRISLNTAIIFEYPSLERLSKHVLAAYGDQIESQLSAPPSVPAATPRPAPVPTQAPAVTTKRHSKRSESRAPAAGADIAVVGMSGRFPKAENVREFWNNLVSGVDGVDELSARYLDQVNYSPKKQKGKTRCKWGGVLAERDCFDPLFFNISPNEAESMNPHQRLVMQESWNAIEDAGYNPRALAGTQTGVFVGSEPTGYQGHTFTGLSEAIIASRLSYVLNFNGPAFVVNTGCSSSGVAIHLGCESLRNRETDVVLAGGVHACMNQATQIRLDEIEMLSPSGRCFTFDAAGDGTIISEGVAMVMLKRLDDAIAAGDHIYGVIKGSGINQDGASNGITAPNGAAQEQLIRSVYDKFQIDPERISYVEAHGTGTRLGDPVETNALVRAFKHYTGKQNYCAVGSAKSHVGHTAAAAGVTGLIKVLLSMQHRQLPKLLNFKTLNPLIEFERSPFYVVTERSAWQPAGQVRMAAINSFGHSGTNVHMVVQEYSPATRLEGKRANRSVIVPLSAKTQEQLQQKGRDLLEFIESADPAIELASLAWTLQTGREAMVERVGFVVRSLDQLKDKLRAWLAGEIDVRGTDKLDQQLASWLQGEAQDWALLWGDARPPRMSLPGYPFARERYWTGLSGLATTSTNLPSQNIEDIIDRIDDDSIDAHAGVQLLKLMV